MKNTPWFFQSCRENCRWFDLVVIWLIAVLIGFLGILYSFCWGTWVLGFNHPHSRHWMDPYDIIGIPIIVAALGMVFLLRAIVLLFAIFALFIALFFIVMMISYGAVPPNMLIIAIVSLLIGVRLMQLTISSVKPSVR